MKASPLFEADLGTYHWPRATDGFQAIIKKGETTVVK
jgi:hypothetical protein